MGNFEKQYKQLNKAQKMAVDTIDGPLLVLAGPGTGKTQLLSARVANILQKTDVSPSNILCLTFTESGASNMRDRLRSFIGDDAYDVTINTYHSFGSDIITQYSQYFQTLSVDRDDDIRLERPIDELSQIQIVGQIVNNLPFDSPLLSSRYYVKSVVSTISDLKQNLISPTKLRELADDNRKAIAAAQQIIDEIINSRGGISRKKAEKQQQYDSLLVAFADLKDELGQQAYRSLQLAHEKSETINSPTPLTSWKNEWLHKDEHDNFTLTEISRTEKMYELANIYDTYQQMLARQAAYDFDDMILRAIEGVATNDELRFNLQERYQYILLDEFQDTNPSQFELVRRIADHPVHEGKPNIMAVGDDDQAIFAFQGAHIGNMRDFTTSFSEVTVINLTENYRSHSDILHVAHGIAGQISDRLHDQIQGIEKILTAQSNSLPKSASLSRHEFSAEASEYAWIAGKVSDLIKKGASASEIAVIAPKHSLLENLVPFMQQYEVGVSYEKRENILETEIIQGLRLAAQLLNALMQNNTAQINQYFPLVLSLPYWEIPAIELWKVNWQFSKRDEERTWPEIAFESEPLSTAITFYLTLAASAGTEPLEITLDKLAGSQAVVISSELAMTAPLKQFYFSEERRSKGALKYYEAVSHLSVIRAKLRDYQLISEHQLRITDFLNFFDMYEAAEANLINAHPMAQSDNSVQLMTAYKAKGLEFEHVFILQAHDDIWGGASRGGGNKLSLPPNLSHIRYTNSGDDERLRLFFVAITRAKHGLYITSHTTKDNGKKVHPLKYLSESDGVSAHLPVHAQAIISEPLNHQKLAKDIETLWRAGQVSLPADFKSLLADRLRNYQMSPTHLGSFIDLEHSGPEAFLVQTLLRFPSAPGPDGEYGTAVHNTLEWYQSKLNSGEKIAGQAIAKRFEYELGRRYLSELDYSRCLGRGKQAIQTYIAARAEMFSRPAKAEVNFRNEGVILGDARLSGKIDRLEVNEQQKTLRIVDYKTGGALQSFNGSIKALKYKQQLYFYKILIEGSHTWNGYTVSEACLEFVEPNKDGATPAPLSISFDAEEEQQLKDLIKAVCACIQQLELPSTETYSKDLKGTQAFINDLLSK